MMGSTNHLNSGVNKRFPKGKRYLKQQIDKMKEEISEKQKRKSPGHFQKVSYL
jgi:hypothetical protein